MGASSLEACGCQPGYYDHAYHYASSMGAGGITLTLPLALALALALALTLTLTLVLGLLPPHQAARGCKADRSDSPHAPLSTAPVLRRETTRWRRAWANLSAEEEEAGASAPSRQAKGRTLSSADGF